MSDNNSGIKASKKTPDGSQAQTPQTQKKETRHAAWRMLCTVCLILFGTIYGISHLLHKHTDTKEVVKTSQKQTAKSKDTSLFQRKN